MATDKKTAKEIQEELESREVAEAAREKEWKQPSLIRELF